MPSKCFGALCNEQSASGGARRREEKRYDMMCPSCHHHVKGTVLQVHCNEGVDRYCLNHPSCKHWKVTKCKRYCVRCFKAMGGAPPSRKRGGALSRRPPALAHELTPSTFRQEIAPMLQTSASLACVKSSCDHQDSLKETSPNSCSTAIVPLIAAARQLGSTAPEPFKKRLRTKSSPPEGVHAANY